MMLVELPLQIGLRVHHPYRLQQSRQQMSRARTRRTIRPLGYEAVVLHEAPIRTWYRTPQNVVVGVGQQQVLGSRGSLEVMSQQTLAPAIEAVQKKLKQTVGRVEEYLLGVSTPWELPHDFRKAAAEVMTMSRLLSELSVLLAVLVDSEEQGDTDYSPLTERTPDGALQIKQALIGHLLRGRSIYRFRNASSLWNLRLRRELLIFETLAVSIESPFFSKLKPYLKFEFERKWSIGTILAAASLLVALGIGKPPPQPPTSSTPVIACQVDAVTPSPSDAVYQRSCQQYLSQLRDGGVKVAQQYLFMLNRDPGPIDGTDGPKTQKAIGAFCKDQGVFASGVQSQEFQQKIAQAMARRYPIHTARE